MGSREKSKKHFRKIVVLKINSGGIFQVHERIRMMNQCKHYDQSPGNSKFTKNKNESIRTIQLLPVDLNSFLDFIGTGNMSEIFEWLIQKNQCYLFDMI